MWKSSGLRPGMATVPGALLLCISSPYARRGALWHAYKDYYGRAGDVLVWQADTRTMHPRIAERVIAQAYARDESTAKAEYGPEFRSDLEDFVSIEVVQASSPPGAANCHRDPGCGTTPIAIRPAAPAASR